MILFLLVSLIHSDLLPVYAEDSAISITFEDNKKLLYSNGGTWIQAADGRWWYRHSDGSYTTSDWEYINGKWYYFDSEGWMVTGWIQLGGSWYYLKPESGEMVTGWQYIGGKTYYFESDGAMVTGWKYIDFYWYYFNDDGSKAIGWKQVGNKWYYLDSDGHMLTGWHYLYYRDDVYNGDPYYNYFNSSGEFVTDSDVPYCAHGYNTFNDHILLNGMTYYYYVPADSVYKEAVIAGAEKWNQLSGCSASFAGFIHLLVQILM